MYVVPRRPLDKREQAQPVILDALLDVARIARQVGERVDGIRRIIGFADEFLRCPTSFEAERSWPIGTLAVRT